MERARAYLSHRKACLPYPQRFEAMSDVQEPLSWGKSTATEAVLEQLVDDRLLPVNIYSERPAWIPPRPEATEPNPPEGYVVSLVRHHERGFSVPIGRFMRLL